MCNILTECQGCKTATNFIDMYNSQALVQISGCVSGVCKLATNFMDLYNSQALAQISGYVSVVYVSQLPTS